jgi:hypothetical protein
MSRTKAINNIREWFDHDRHPPGIGMEKVRIVRHETHMARKEHEIAPLER